MIIRFVVNAQADARRRVLDTARTNNLSEGRLSALHVDEQDIMYGVQHRPPHAEPEALRQAHN